MNPLHCLLPLALASLLTQDAPTAAEQGIALDGAAAEQAEEFFLQAGIELSLEQKRVSIPARVVVRNELLEFLLVLPHGAMHESLLSTEVDVELLNAALLTLGVQTGKDADWAPKNPPPTEEERAAGVRPYDVVLPEGDTFYLYLGWQVEGEAYLYRVEDLLRNLRTQRSMRRHPWVYLGSKMVETRDGEVFGAVAAGNLVNITFFKGGSTSLMTAGLLDCADQSIWLANAWLLPEMDSEVRLFFCREPMSQAAPGLIGMLPEVGLPGAELPGDPGGSGR